MPDQAQRIAEILQRTKEPYIHDSRDKMKQIDELFAQWDKGSVSADAVADVTQRHAHSMKGLALTLSFPAVNQACEDILASILHQEDRPWTTSELKNLRLLAGRLSDSMRTDFG